MKKAVFFLFIFFISLNLNASAQTYEQTPSAQIDNISEKLTSISGSLNSLNEKLENFAKTFSSNQGLRLTEKQQTLLLAFELLNRSEQRLSTLKLLKIDMSEKLTTVRLKLSEVEEKMQPESIERGVSFVGTTKTEELRESRRQALFKERSELNSLINEIQNSLNDTNVEIRETEMFLQRIRRRIFPAIDKEISDL